MQYHSLTFVLLLLIGIKVERVKLLSTTTNSRLQRQLPPCDHPLRLAHPHLFTHCDCTYLPWSEWTLKTGFENVPADPNIIDCASGSYFVQQRTKVALNESCEAVSEEQNVCSPTKEERLIIGLGLGGSEQDLEQTTTNTNSPFKTSLWAYLIKPIFGPACKKDKEVCHHLSASRICRKREIYDKVMVDRKKRNNNRIINSLHNGNVQTIPFNYELHGSHFRQRRSAQCQEAEIQHVLFVIDSSGSVSESDFNDMKESLTKLVPLFCKKIKVALINFSADIKLEFCFDCFGNDASGRKATQDAITASKRMGKCTNTGATAKCICDHILDSSCGIDYSIDQCIDVVFITDGKSNDPKHKVCNEIKCLHKQLGINTFGIGIGGYDKAELDCITGSSNSWQTFEYENMKEFKESIDSVSKMTENALLNGNFESCGNPKFQSKGGGAR